MGPWDGDLSFFESCLFFLEAKSISLVFHRWKDTVTCLRPVAFFFFFKPTWKLFGIVAQKWSFFFCGWGYGHSELQMAISWTPWRNITRRNETSVLGMWSYPNRKESSQMNCSQPRWQTAMRFQPVALGFVSGPLADLWGSDSWVSGSWFQDQNTLRGWGPSCR